MTAASDGGSISLVVPACNEEPRIGASLDRLVQYLGRAGYVFEILVVDDGSTDGTAAAVEDHPGPNVQLLRLPENRGKGAAVRTGVLASTHDLVLISDADLSTPVEQVEKLLPALEEAPIVIASRQAPGAVVRRTISRRLSSRTFNTVLAVMGLCPGIQDTQCGFKLLEGAVARALFAQMETDGFGFDVELLELARHEGRAIREVGVVWEDSGESTVRFVRDTRRMLVEAWRVRRRMRRLRR